MGQIPRSIERISSYIMNSFEVYLGLCCWCIVNGIVINVLEHYFTYLNVNSLKVLR